MLKKKVSVLKAPNLLNDDMIIKELKFTKAPYLYLPNILHPLWDMFLLFELLMALITF